MKKTCINFCIVLGSRVMNDLVQIVLSAWAWARLQGKQSLETPGDARRCPEKRGRRLSDYRCLVVCAEKSFFLLHSLFRISIRECIYTIHAKVAINEIKQFNGNQIWAVYFLVLFSKLMVSSGHCCFYLVFHT